MMENPNVTFGKHRGFVEDNLDPNNLGRLRVRVPGILGDLTVWAMPCVAYAGSGSGIYMVPEKGTGVWIEFEAGDLSKPIWSGCWWDDGQLPEDHEDATHGPEVKLIRSENGLLIELDDDEQQIIFSDGIGSNHITIEVQKGKVEIKGKTKIVIKAPQIELGGNVDQPVVLGGELLQYLNQLAALYNSHIHPGQTILGIPVTPAPPAPPLPPATLDLLSKAVKTE